MSQASRRQTDALPPAEGAALPARKATKVTLPTALVAEAKALGVNVSQAVEAGLVAAVAQRRQECWLQLNAAALDSSNAYVNQHGLPLAKHRAF